MQIHFEKSRLTLASHRILLDLWDEYNQRKSKKKRKNKNAVQKASLQNNPKTTTRFQKISMNILC